MPARRPAVLSLGLILLAAGAGAQQPAEPIPTLTATTRLVVLDVVVNDGHGHPLKGLTTADFALTEDGIPQTVQSVTEHAPINPPAPEVSTLAKPVDAAMNFGAPTPADLPFHLTVTPVEEKLHGPGEVPRGDFLRPGFTGKPFRRFLLHYTLNADDLHPAAQQSEQLQLLAVVYRDDGAVANGFRHIATVNPANRTIAIDQEITIPLDGNFFLRTAVHEAVTGRLGAIELPIEWIKQPPPDPVH